jgi:hypothetical protein
VGTQDSRPIWRAQPGFDIVDANEDILWFEIWVIEASNDQIMEARAHRGHLPVSIAPQHLTVSKPKSTVFAIRLTSGMGPLYSAQIEQILAEHLKDYADVNAIWAFKIYI